MTTTEEMVTRREPILGQVDLHCIREPAARIRNLRGAAPYLSRNLSRAELQLLALADAVCELVVGSLGEDANGDTVGELVLREVPGLPLCHQPKLTEGNGS